MRALLLAILLLLLTAFLTVLPISAQSAREVLQDCIAAPERHTVAECDTAYARWKAVRIDRFKRESATTALAVPQTDQLSEAAVTWFGAIDQDRNYADVRIAHSGQTLLVSVSVVDQYLSEGADRVTVTVGSVTETVALSRDVPWRGTGFDDGKEDRGWIASFRIPGIASGVTLPLTVTLRDETKAAQTYQTSIRTSPEPFSPAPGSNTETIDLVVEKDVAVGGAGTCSADIDPLFFAKFGTVDRRGEPDFNVQNQGDIADWPCFSKWFGIFPSVNGAVVRAELILHQFGASGGPDWNPPAERSLIQVATTDVWSGSLTWNTAPYPKRIVGRSWVDLMRVPLVWPGVARTFDVSPAVVPGQKTALVLYTADLRYHSGKYFVSGSTGDWNAAGRPRLRVTLAR